MNERQRTALVAGGLLSIGDAAALLAVSRTKLYALMSNGELPFVLIGRARRIPKNAIDAFATARLHVRA